MAAGDKHHHFLLVIFGLQSHINPARALAHRLTRLGGANGSIRVTLCLSVSTHRRMFPSSSDGAEEASDGVVSYVPYSDGLSDNDVPKDDEARARSRRAAVENLSSVIAGLADRGRPVTCVMCTMVLPHVLDVTSKLSIPLAVFWIQPAHVLAVYYHYFHGYADLVASHAATDRVHEVSLPGLTRPLRIRDFPSFLVDTTGSELARVLNLAMGELFEYMDRQRRTKLLVNTFDELEPGVLADMKQRLDVFAVGPMVASSTEPRLDLFEHDDVGRKRYMDWLGSQRENSVVYVSFGSISKQKKQQMEEIVQGLKQCGRPYLLVVRKDGLEEDMMGYILESIQDHDHGMVVEWCNQVEVLSHAAVGCFVTHCGWNSTLEAMATGVPVIGVPKMIDQPTIAFLVEEEWQNGMKIECNNEGILTRTELARCIELIMGEGAKASVIREKAKALKEIAQEVVAANGLVEINLLDFIKTI